jgi:hypothetical protein
MIQLQPLSRKIKLGRKIVCGDHHSTLQLPARFFCPFTSIAYERSSLHTSSIVGWETYWSGW